MKTHRDAWAYNFSKGNLAENMQKTIRFYNSEVERYQQSLYRGKRLKKKPVVNEFVNYDSTKIHWGDLTGYIKKNEASNFSTEETCVMAYIAHLVNSGCILILGGTPADTSNPAFSRILTRKTLLSVFPALAPARNFLR